MFPIKYLAHVDGLRAVAVLPVILFHLDKEVLPGGFLGVDLFFVISGFLITSILLADMREGKFSFLNFWARRIRRIMPLVGTMVCTTLIAFTILGFPGSLVEHAQTGLAAVVMLANFQISMSSGDYWGSAAESSPFLHTWSLSVEEQFYIFFPGLLYITLRNRPELLTRMIVIVTLGSFGLFAALLEYRPTVAFYMLPSRAWELGVGCLLAISQLGSPRRVMAEILVLAGASCIVAAYFLAPTGEQTVVYTSAAVLGAALLIQNGERSVIAQRTLANPLMVWVGKLSFSLYIWHWPVIVLSKDLGRATATEPNMAVLLIIIFVLSVLSYRLIEVPVRHASGSLAIPLGFPTSATITAIGLIIFWSPNLARPEGYDPVTYAGPFYDLSPRQPPETQQTLSKRIGIEMTIRPVDRDQIYRTGGLLRDYGVNGRIMMLGDSHALMWAPVMDSIAQSNGYSLMISGMTATQPYFDFVDPSRLRASARATREERIEIAEARRQVVNTWQPDIVVVSTRNLPDRSVLTAFVQYFQERDVAVVFILQPPVLDIGNVSAHQYLSYVLRYREIDPAQPVRVHTSREHVEQNTVLSSIVALCATCHLLDIAPLLGAHGDRVNISNQNQILYYDDDHLSIEGATLIAPTLQETIAEILFSTD